MNIQQLDRECTGCGCCVNVCFKNCISMEYNEEGFKYPFVDETICVQCGQCIAKCPISTKYKSSGTQLVKRLSIPDTYVAFAKDVKLRKKSASGGIATVLAYKINELSGIVCGAVMTENFEVVHHLTSNVKDIKQFSGSKYVQSDIVSTYKSVKSHLDKGKLVLYTGTGCQIAGIKSYLGHDYDNLFCVDLVCTGVTPPKLFQRYVKECHKSNVRHVTFHAKDRGWENYCIKFDYEKSAPLIESGSKNLYSVGFLSGMFLRNSCFECCFRGRNSEADITLGDPWGGLYHGRLGASMVLVNTEKGQKIFELIKNRIRKSEVTLGYLMKCNGYYLGNSRRKPQYRDECIKQLLNTRFMKFQMIKWCGKSRISRKLRSC